MRWSLTYETKHSKLFKPILPFPPVKMHLKSLLSACLSLAYLSGTAATVTNLDSLYNPGLIKRGFSLLDARQEPTSPSTTPTPSSDPNDPNATRLVQVVKVSDNNGTLKFWPESIKANVGDVVQFHFYPKVSKLIHPPKKQSANIRCRITQ